MKKCPYCAEQIQDEAIKCRFCGENLLLQAPTDYIEIDYLKKEARALMPNYGIVVLFPHKIAKKLTDGLSLRMAKRISGLDSEKVTVYEKRITSLINDVVFENYRFGDWLINKYHFDSVAHDIALKIMMVATEKK